MLKRLLYVGLFLIVSNVNASYYDNERHEYREHHNRNHWRETEEFVERQYQERDERNNENCQVIERRDEYNTYYERRCVSVIRRYR